MEKFVESYVAFRSALLASLGEAAAGFPEDSIVSLYATMLKDTRDREVAQMRNGHGRTNGQTNGAPAAGNGTAPKCPVHGSVMKPGKKGGWYCPRKLDNGNWCDQRAK